MNYYTLTSTIVMLSVACAAAADVSHEPKDVQRAFADCIQKLEHVSNYQASYTVNLTTMKGPVNQSGSIVHAPPFTFRCEEDTSAMDGIMNVKELTVCDGSNGWEISMTPSGKIVNASRWSTPSMQEIFYAFMNKAQFPMLSHDRSNSYYMIRYDFLFDSVTPKSGGYVFSGTMRPGTPRYASIYRMAQTMGPEGVSNFVPQRITLTANEFGVPVAMNQYNRKSEPVIAVALSKVQVNQTLDPELFTYTPPADVMVLDMDKAIFQEPVHVPHELMNEKAPAISVKYLSGKTKTVKPGSGPVVLTFFASWSENCRKYLMVVEKLYQRYNNQGVQFITVTDQQDVKTVKAYCNQAQLTMPVYTDPSGNITKDFKIKVVPKTMLINANGVIVDVMEGNAPTIDKELDASIQKILPPAK